MNRSQQEVWESEDSPLLTLQDQNSNRQPTEFSPPHPSHSSFTRRSRSDYGSAFTQEQQLRQIHLAEYLEERRIQMLNIVFQNL
jgi:hypothetical protein